MYWDWRNFIQIPISLIVLLSNIILGILVLNNPQLRTQKDVIVVTNLAFSDTIFTITTFCSVLSRLIYDILESGTSMIPRQQCLYLAYNNIYPTAYHLFPLASVLVSLERFLAAWFPEAYRKTDRGLSIKIVTVTWVYSLVFGFVGAYCNFTMSSFEVSIKCYSKDFIHPTIYDIMLLGRWACMLTSVLLYIPVFVKMLQLSSRIRRRLCDSMRVKQSKKLIKTTTIFGLLVCGSIFLIIIPDILLLYTEFGREQKAILYIINAVKPLLNVFVISALHRDIRKQILRMCCISRFMAGSVIRVDHTNNTAGTR